MCQDSEEVYQHNADGSVDLKPCPGCTNVDAEHDTLVSTCEACEDGVVTDTDQGDSTYEVHYSHDDEYGWHDLSWKAELIQ